MKIEKSKIIVFCQNINFKENYCSLLDELLTPIDLPNIQHDDKEEKNRIVGQVLENLREMTNSSVNEIKSKFDEQKKRYSRFL